MTKRSSRVDSYSQGRYPGGYGTVTVLSGKKWTGNIVACDCCRDTCQCQNWAQADPLVSSLTPHEHFFAPFFTVARITDVLDAHMRRIEQRGRARGQLCQAGERVLRAGHPLLRVGMGGEFPLCVPYEGRELFRLHQGTVQLFVPPLLRLAFSSACDEETTNSSRYRQPNFTEQDVLCGCCRSLQKGS